MSTTAESIVSINPEEAKKKLSIIRQYSQELMLITFGVAIVYLFTGLRTLESDFRKYILEDKKDAVQHQVESTKAVQQNTEVMKEVKDAMIEVRQVINEVKK